MRGRRWATPRRLPARGPWFEDRETGATMQRAGCMALSEAIFASTVGSLVAGVLFAIANIELQHTRERQAAGITTAQAKGVYQGRAKGPPGLNPAGLPNCATRA